jgi:hypothetical protein
MRFLQMFLVAVFCMFLFASCSGGTGVMISDRELDNGNGNTDDPLGVAISPQTLLTESVQGGSVVVHTKIPYSTVDRHSVQLEGVDAVRTKADLTGALVAYFREADIKVLVSPPEATLTLTGLYLDGTPFEGSDTVKVKAN